MPGCAIYGCGNYNKVTKGTDVRYYSFPKEEEMLKQWINACRRADEFNLKNACICSIHFEPHCFEISIRQKFFNYLPKNSRNLKSDAVPTLNLPNNINARHKSKRPGRISKRKEIEHINLPMPEIFNIYKIEKTEELSENEETIESLEEQNIAYMETIEANNPNEEIAKLKEKIAFLEQENFALSNQVRELNNFQSDIEIKLGKIFTPGQINKILYPENIHHRWSQEDISSAISLRNVSPEAYRYLRLHGYPLPTLSTLQK